MGSCEPLFLQMQPNLIPHLEIAWNPVLVMSLFILSIGLFQNVLDLLANLLDSFNKYGGIISLSMSMIIFLLCGCKGQSYINWGQLLETQGHLKKVVTDRAMKRFVIAMLKIRKALIPCASMFRIVHS